MKHVIVRVILTLAISRKWHVTQLDVNDAFLNGLLAKEVYMQQPPGFLNVDAPLVCKLNKAMYGPNRHPGPWFERLTTTLHTFGFQTSKCDPSLFTLTTPYYTIFITS